MTNAQEVFNHAMALMDEFSTSTDDNGNYIPNENDTLEYKARTLAILNVLAGELFPFSDTFSIVEDGKRPICTAITDFTTAISLDDYICRSVMPYGLAAHLLLQEDPSSANYFQQRYDELKGNLQRGLPAESTDITDVYSGYYDADGNWVSCSDPIGFSGGGRW